MNYEVQQGYDGQQQPPLPQEAPWQAGGGQQPFEGMSFLQVLFEGPDERFVVVKPA